MSWVIAHKGIVYARISAQGVAAHSAHPEKGDSAIDKLIDILNRVRETEFPTDSNLGETHFNIGKIEGGESRQRGSGSCTSRYSHPDRL